ncbi:ATPase [Aestuariibacter sp. GS-14]|uniref:BadF/BadG/BcrA/BcrD ATPase family protein n=1 Tax=Aestuariibacter sp. GS-14 TaxID=2590670 RepID=UPI00112B8644|nr:BadF/BadG/BcrA/BcrD ATPase family protein [Aestuariibacter sp. GS-14]TPV58313.1 ATPase [Aestuariibacter sp. GS-14]
MTNSKQRYWVGIDGGGTKCRAVLFSEQGDALAEGLGGPANIARYKALALDAMLDAVKAAVAQAGLEFDEVSTSSTVCAGLAGAFLPSSRQLLSQWQHPFGNFVFTSDLQIALLGAHGGQDGAVMIAGTGSCAATLCKVNGDFRVKQVGGYGFQLGDQASGAWLGRQAVQQALLHADAIVEAPGIYTLVTGFYQCQSATDIVDRLNQGQPGEFAQLAPGLFALAKHDEQARQLLQSGAEYLNALAKSALTDASLKLVFLGGLAEKWTPLLNTDIQKRLIQPLHSAEWGAMFYARTLQASQSTVCADQDALVK